MRRRGSAHTPHRNIAYRCHNRRSHRPVGVSAPIGLFKKREEHSNIPQILSLSPKTKHLISKGKHHFPQGALSFCRVNIVNAATHAPGKTNPVHDASPDTNISVAQCRVPSQAKPIKSNQSLHTLLQTSRPQTTIPRLSISRHPRLPNEQRCLFLPTSTVKIQNTED